MPTDPDELDTKLEQVLQDLQAVTGRLERQADRIEDITFRLDDHRRHNHGRDADDRP